MQLINRTFAHGLIVALTLLSFAPYAMADTLPPELRYNRDNEFSIVDMNTEPKVVFRVDYKDASGIDLKSIRVLINDEDVTGLARIFDTHLEIIYLQPEGGLYHAEVEVRDVAGNKATIAWDVMYQAC